jgi:hypothetical protein
MNGHIYLFMVLGALPPNNCERAWLFSGYVCIKARANKKCGDYMPVQANGEGMLDILDN